MTRPTCNDCRFFSKVSKSGNPECHRELKSTYIGTSNGPALVSGWPTVDAESLGCAAFQPVSINGADGMSGPRSVLEMGIRRGAGT